MSGIQLKKFHAGTGGSGTWENRGGMGTGGGRRELGWEAGFPKVAGLNWEKPRTVLQHYVTFCNGNCATWSEPLKKWRNMEKKVWDAGGSDTNPPVNSPSPLYNICKVHLIICFKVMSFPAPATIITGNQRHYIDL